MLSKKLVFILFVIPFLLTGCSLTKKNNNFSIATTFPATAYITEQLTAGTTDSVTNYAGSSPDPHDIDLSAKNATSILNSNLIIYIPTTQAAIDKIANNFDPQHTVQWSGGTHPWLSPANSMTLTKNIYQKLIDLNPSNKDTYSTNYKNFMEQLQKLVKSYSVLKNAKQKYFVDTHNAFADMATQYGLTELSINGADDESEPSLKTIRTIVAKIKSQNIKTVFYENDSDKSTAQKVASMANCNLLLLNTFEASSNADYLNVLSQNLVNLTKVLKPND